MEMNNHQKLRARNVYACLVHEKRECIIDLVRNLRFHDNNSPIILYNGGYDPDLLTGREIWSRLGVVVHPSPQPMTWGYLHNFALDCLRLAIAHFSFDCLTIVDSDQLALQSGYCDHMGRVLAQWPSAGVLGEVGGPHGRRDAPPPAQRIWDEYALWKGFLARAPGGEEACIHSLFWPATVFTERAARDLCDLWAREPALRAAFGRTKAWATEEVVLPTLVAMLGYEIRTNPCCRDYVKFRKDFTLADLDQALARPDAFWMHPVPRQMGHPLRVALRDRTQNDTRELPMPPVNTDDLAAFGSPPLLLVSDILQVMHTIPGWLRDDEADLLIAVLARVVMGRPGPHTIVEVGCHKGRATVVLARVLRQLSPDSHVYAVDPHDGLVGAGDQKLYSTGPTLAAFQQNIENAGVADLITPIVSRTGDLGWDRPVQFLLIDGLHDYASVAADFRSFERWLLAGACIAFHDYAPAFPGVLRFVDELLRQPAYRPVTLRGSMILVQYVSVQR
jgi:SAM-dependent methyltransferase